MKNYMKILIQKKNLHSQKYFNLYEGLNVAL
jgi:hypothetical protein